MNEDYARHKVLEQQLRSIPGMREKLGLNAKANGGAGANTVPCASDAGGGATAPAAPVAQETEPAAPKDDHEITSDVLELLRRLIVAQPHELDILALWILHTHALLEVGAAYTPYIVVTSAEKQSGKTRVLEVSKPLVPNPLMTASISPAALARMVHEEHNSLLLDEYDGTYSHKANEELAEALRSILNSGFHIAGAYTRMTGVGAAMRPQHFSTFGPKMLGGIGTVGVLPDTVLSRSLVIRLKRAQRGQAASFRPDGQGQASKALRSEMEKLRIRAAKWAHRHAAQIANCEPAISAQFSDRQADISEPLLAIAEVLGGQWPTRVTKALGMIFASPAAEDNSQRVLLLAHIRKIFRDKFDNYENPDQVKFQLPTELLLEALCAIAEAPWGEWNLGKGIGACGLAKLLREFEISSRSIRDSTGKVVRGYRLADFFDAFDRYLSPVCLCPGCDCHIACSGSCSGLEDEDSASVHAVCSGVAAQKEGTPGREDESSPERVN